MDKRLDSLLKLSYTPPAPIDSEMEKFIDSMSYPKAKFSEVFISQVKFIRKRIWVTFILFSCFAFLYTVYTDIAINVVAIVSAIFPLFSLCVITELFKDRAYNMAEMEFCCRYNLSKIMLMRLSVLGLVSFIMLVFFVCIATKSDFGAFRNVVYISVPYLLSSYVSLMLISKFHSIDTIYICAGVSGTISVAIMLLSTHYSFIYNINFTNIWNIIFMLLIILFSYSIKQFIKSQEELQWNLL